MPGQRFRQALFPPQSVPPTGMGFVAETGTVTYLSATSFKVDRYAQNDYTRGTIVFFTKRIYAKVVSTSWDGTYTTVVLSLGVCWPSMASVFFIRSGGIDPCTEKLFHFDGGSLDEISGGNITLGGSSIVTTGAGTKFGAGCLSIASGCAYTTVSNIVSADFTVDFWLYKNAHQTSNSGPFTNAFNWSAASGIHLYAGPSDTYMVFSPAANINTGGRVLALSTLYHIQFGRQGNTIYFFIDGTLIGTSTYSGTLAQGNTIYLGGGNANYIGGPDMRIDEFRFSTICRNIASFTPPTAPYTY